MSKVAPLDEAYSIARNRPRRACKQPDRYEPASDGGKFDDDSSVDEDWDAESVGSNVEWEEEDFEAEKTMGCDDDSFINDDSDSRSSDYGGESNPEDTDEEESLSKEQLETSPVKKKLRRQ
ncbi:MAG: hypothetical protein CMA10_04745 [Euryarchaeota archaeon]|nr:hypothetical protein [Euryarchaeota archaeon]|tara:strand:- start:5736 stop:6098 length:363 start_codon:yes stop_codon:yes gene_type:complete